MAFHHALFQHHTVKPNLVIVVGNATVCVCFAFQTGKFVSKFVVFALIGSYLTTTNLLKVNVMPFILGGKQSPR